MIRQYNFDHSQAVVAGAIYPSEPFYRTGWSSFVHNGEEPSHIAIANLCYGAVGQYFMLVVTAESPKVVREKMVEFKQQFGINSKPLQQPPSELETDLAQELVLMQAKFELMKTR